MYLYFFWTCVPKELFVPFNALNLKEKKELNFFALSMNDAFLVLTFRQLTFYFPLFLQVRSLTFSRNWIMSKCRKHFLPSTNEVHSTTCIGIHSRLTVQILHWKYYFISKEVKIPESNYKTPKKTSQLIYFLTSYDSQIPKKSNITATIGWKISDKNVRA